MSLRGRVAEIVADDGLKDIDRISDHYRGEPYRNRESPRFSAWIEIDSWHAWNV